jgi:hypothetical protein
VYIFWIIDDNDCGAVGGMNGWQLKPKYTDETCPSAAYFTTNPTFPDPGSNLSRRFRKPTTNRLSYVAPQAKVVEALGLRGVESYIVLDIPLAEGRGLSAIRASWLAFAPKCFLRIHFC